MVGPGLACCRVGTLLWYRRPLQFPGNASAPTIRAASSGNEAAKSAETVGSAQRRSESWRCALGDAVPPGYPRRTPPRSGIG